MIESKKNFYFIGLKFDSCTMSQVVKRLEYFLGTKKPHMISTITAELVVRANKDELLRKIYNKVDILAMDSFVVYYAACLFRKPAARPVHATRLALEFLPVMNEKLYSLYILGAKDNIVRQAVENIKLRYPKINIVGFHHGYFDFKNNRKIVEDIKQSRPDVLFVAMSSPLKENFIAKNLLEMNVPVCVAVGGGVDIIAGKCHLAPLWVSKIGLEWFYRFIQEPRRMWKRYLVTNIKFLCLLGQEIFKNNGEKYER
ncbi:MAG: WecB/TagA/CpsF family glycosyltransferase [Candidatus Omnitrophota bacterium]